MKDSPLNCNFPQTDLEQQLEKKLYRTHGARLASPPARKVAGVSDSSEEMNFGVTYISERFMDIRTAFLILRRSMLGIVNLFMIVVLGLMWIVDALFSGEALLAAAALFVPLWISVYLFEIFFPLTLPVRIDRQEGFVYVGHRGTFYRIPWDEMEVTFSYNWQYLGSGVVWDRQYYSHLFLRDKFYFCGKTPKKPLQRKKISSTFNESMMYRRWNFIVRYYKEGVVEEDADHLAGVNFDSLRKEVSSSLLGKRIVEYFFLILLMPNMVWSKFSPFKYKWPKEIEAIFGKINYY
ncbi:hypothetical protein [Marinobacter sp. ATCH36]|uniref:hypothetical protein n=1 Tax=Marinobacter sp. ATCH36 TaxID=2945106 RepID=UPI002020C8FF|nr:hypothetical protein [Marinobacter sp. ATCH36]MCL7942986.1 hypothetical protein [Marinobacter sp. ATCH36]